MSKNGGKSAKSAALTAEKVVFISGKTKWWSLTGSNR
jgi:hypothetical protein